MVYLEAHREKEFAVKLLLEFSIDEEYYLNKRHQLLEDWP